MQFSCCRSNERRLRSKIHEIPQQHITSLKCKLSISHTLKENTCSLFTTASAGALLSKRPLQLNAATGKEEKVSFFETRIQALQLSIDVTDDVDFREGLETA